jgi:hypothetical protein
MITEFRAYIGSDGRIHIHVEFDGQGAVDFVLSDDLVAAALSAGTYKPEGGQ